MEHNAEYQRPSPGDEEISKHAAKDALGLFDPEVARKHGWLSPEEYRSLLESISNGFERQARETKRADEAERRAEAAEKELYDLKEKLRDLGSKGYNFNLPPKPGVSTTDYVNGVYCGRASTLAYALSDIGRTSR